MSTALPPMLSTTSASPDPSGRGAERQRLPAITHSISQTSSSSFTEDSDSQAPGLTSCPSQTSHTEEDDEIDETSPFSPPFVVPAAPTHNGSRLQVPAVPPKKWSKPHHVSTSSPRSLHSRASSPERFFADDAGYDSESELDYSDRHHKHPHYLSSKKRLEEHGHSAATTTRPALTRAHAHYPVNGHTVPSSPPSTSKWGFRRTSSPATTPHKEYAHSPLGHGPRPASPNPVARRQIDRPRVFSSPVGLGFRHVDVDQDDRIHTPPTSLDTIKASAEAAGGLHEALERWRISVPPLAVPDTPQILAFIPPADPSPLELSSPTTAQDAKPKKAPKPSLTPLRRPTHTPTTSSPLSGSHKRSRNFSPLSPPRVPPSTPIPPGLRNSPHLKRIKDYTPRVPSAPLLSSTPTFDPLADGRMHRHALFAPPPSPPPPFRYVVTPPPGRTLEFEVATTEGSHNPYFSGV